MSIYITNVTWEGQFYRYISNNITFFCCVRIE